MYVNIIRSLLQQLHAGRFWRHLLDLGACIVIDHLSASCAQPGQNDGGRNREEGMDGQGRERMREREEWRKEKRERMTKRGGKERERGGGGNKRGGE